MTSDTMTSQREIRPAWRIAITVETVIYCVAFLVAVGLRWIELGTAPLSSDEAPQAVAAWSLVTPGAPSVGVIESPLVFGGAAVSIVIAGASNAAARFVPMLAGVALVFSPLALRRRLGRLPTLLAVLLLAVSPVAVVGSRRVDGVGFAMLALVLGLTVLDEYLGGRSRRSLFFVGIALGIALLADYGTLVALLSMLLGIGFAFLTDEERILTAEALNQALRDLPWRVPVASLLGTLGVLGTLFFLAPGGLGALADQLSQFAGGFARRPPGAPYTGLVLLIYEPLLLLFGLIGAWLASQSARPWWRFLAGWGVGAILLNLIYPGSLPLHGLWSVVPLAMLGGLAIERLFQLESGGPRWGNWAYAVAILAFFALTFASVSHHLRAPQVISMPPGVPPDQAVFNLPFDLILVLIWLILIIVLGLMFTSTWGPYTTLHGLGTGLLILGLTLSFGQSGAIVFTRATSPYELLNPLPAQPALDVLVETAGEVSELATGNPRDASITVQAQPDSALAWALLGFKDLAFVERVDPTVESIMVITPAEMADPALGSSYVGQDFVIVRHWNLGGLSAGKALQWVFYRTADTPASEARVILWVREDVYRLVPGSGPLP